MTLDLALVVVCGLLALVAAFSGVLKVLAKTASQVRHARYRKLAKRALRTISQIGPREHPQRVFGYLRALNPYVFEELILHAFEVRGCKVERSKSYSGDGGIDGAVHFNGRRLLIQAKRYRKHVNAGHVLQFKGVCRTFRAQGLFFHTGRTGALSRTHATECGTVQIVSGGDLLRFFGGEALRIDPAFKR